MSNEQAIAESTTKVYLFNIGVIARSMGYKDVPTTGDWLQNSEQIIEHLSRIKNLNTRKNKLMTIIVVARAYDLPAAVVDAYSKEADKLSGQLQAFLSTNEKSERQRNNWMTKEELQTFAATLKANIPRKIKSFEDYERVMRYVLVQFHLSRPIRNDWADAKVYLQADKPTQDQASNYILLNKSRKSAVLVLNNYKTFKFYGKKTIDVEPALAALLIRYYAAIKAYSPGALAASSQTQQGSGSRGRFRESHANRLQEIPAAKVQAHGKARELHHDSAQHCERRVQHEAAQAAGGGGGALGGQPWAKMRKGNDELQNQFPVCRRK
jgi:hypothetical protein